MDQADAERTLAAVAEEVEAASFGFSSWANVAGRLVDGFPGSACAILNEDQLQKVLRHYDAINVERHHMEAYAEYFAFRNPWLKVWSYLPDGACAVSERDFPVKQIAHTEFYNDFIRRVPNFDASTGISLDIDPFNTFRIPLHYPIAFAERYDPWAEFILTGLKGVLKRTANGLIRINEDSERQIARAALANRMDEIAIVVDGHMKVVDANEAAVSALRQRNVLFEKQGRLFWRERKLADSIPMAVRSIASSPSSQASSLTVNTESGRWIVYFSLISGSRSNLLVAPRPLVLIQARNISVAPTPRPLADFARMFSLTPAEQSFYSHLVAGVSVKEAAVATGVTFETARSRLRTIFQKTDVHRQAELVSLPHRFSGL